MKKNPLIMAVAAFLFFVLSVSPLPAGQVILPGNSQAFLQYLEYSYASPQEHLLYYLNEMLLFEEMPVLPRGRDRYVITHGSTNFRRKAQKSWDLIRSEYKIALENTFRARIQRIFQRHSETIEFLSKTAGNPSGPLNMDLNTAEGYSHAAKLLKLMGLVLSKKANGTYTLEEERLTRAYYLNHYYLVLGIDIQDLASHLNKNQKLEYRLDEFAVDIPWDINFLREVTRFELTPRSFAAFLVKESRLRLFLALLYRLSRREIDFISSLEPRYNAWKKIYRNDSLLSGMFVLSHALRVSGKTNRLLLPGGDAAASFWETMTGFHPFDDPLKFLQSLAVKDDGKLNYFYVFGFFLPDDTRQAVFAHFNPVVFRQVYDPIQLDKGEKIKGLKVPGLRNFSFFSLMYALKTRGSQIDFPGGTAAWTAVTRALGNSPFGLLKYAASAKGEQDLTTFISIYSKFYTRPQLLTQDVLRLLYDNYLDYNVLVDFIEKIPIRKPETVIKLFSWVKTMEPSGKEKQALIAILQSLMGILAHGAAYDPQTFHYDSLLTELTDIPINGAEAYDALFRFFQNSIGIDLSPQNVDRSFLDFLLNAVWDEEVTIHGQPYILKSASHLRESVSRIMESQQVCLPSQLVVINRLLESFRTCEGETESKEIGKKLVAAFDSLIHPQVGPDVPFFLKNRVEGYSKTGLYKSLARLLRKKKQNAPLQEIDTIIQKIKAGCLLHQLKNYLLTGLYAVTAKDSNLRVFLSPHLTRFHDFSPHKGEGPWNSCGISEQAGLYRVYHLSGGLSRLNLLLAAPFGESLLGKKIGFHPCQTTPLIFNNLELYPQPVIKDAQEYTGLLVAFGLQLLENAGKDSTLREALEDELAKITAGYHYRKIIAKLEGESVDFRLFFSEILRLGERFFHARKFTSKFEFNSQLEAFRDPATGFVKPAVQEEMNRFGSIYYSTFGTLRPYRYALFPQSLSHLFRSPWVGGEMIDEFKIKAAYISYLKKFPPEILGHLIYHYLYMAPRIYDQDYKNDYHRVYNFYDTYNYLYLQQLYKDLRKKGILRIK